MKAERKIIFFVDEVQMCRGFELAIDSLYAKRKNMIFILPAQMPFVECGSCNAFTGRYMEIHVFPFSFKEYCTYYDTEKDVDKLFDDYVMQGGLSGSYLYKNTQDSMGYIREIYYTIIHRDLVRQYNLPDTVVLDMLSEYLMDNISNLTSPNRISNTLQSNKVSTNHVTTGKYIKYLCSAFCSMISDDMIYVERNIFRHRKKYYLCDTGLRQAVLGTRNMDYGRVYENIVCLELLRRGYEVYVGKLYKKRNRLCCKKKGMNYCIFRSVMISAVKKLSGENMNPCSALRTDILK